MKCKVLFIVYLCCILCATQVSTAQSVVVNEVMYVNKTILFDENGKTPDWIELYNSTDSPINLKEWMLTDDTVKTNFWKFPSVIIPPNSFLLVYASGKNVESETEIHTDFKLSSMKEGVFLFNANKELQNFFPIRCVPIDLSLGYKIDGSGAICVLEPSPNQTNNFSDSVHISYSPSAIQINYGTGLYNSAIHVTLKTLDSNSVIYYTTNGEEPDEESQVYSAPIYIQNRSSEENEYADIRTSSLWRKPDSQVFKVTPLRAVAYNSGCIASEEVIRTYCIDTNIRKKYSVPIVSIITNPDNLFDDDEGIYVFGNNGNCLKHGKKWERDAYIEMIDTTNTVIIHQNIDLRIHGGTSRAAPQKSLRLYAEKKYGVENFNYPFFSEKPLITSFKTLVLRSARDWTYTLFKDELCQDIVNDMNIDNTPAIPVIVFIDGEYWGIHSLREYQDENYIKSKHGITDSIFDIISYNGASKIKAEEGTIDSYNDLIYFLEHNDISIEENFEKVCAMIDIDNLIDYFIAESYFGNSDFPKKNVKMWKSAQDDNAKWRYFFYDCDGCMLRTNYNLTDEYLHSIEEFHEYPDWSTFILRCLFQNRTFQMMYVQRFYYHLNTTFRPDVILNKIDEFEKRYEPLAAEHTLRWRLPEDVRKWKYNVNSIRLFAIQRPIEIYKELQQNFENPFIVYPNPITQNQGFSIYCSQQNSCETIEIQIYSLAGTSVFFEQLSTCDVSNKTFNPLLQSGVYSVQIIYQQFVFTSKLIVL